MNRNNVWIHVGIAVVLIVIAAVLGQIARWKSALKEPVVAYSTSKKERCDARKQTPALSATAPEVLVRFKPGVTLDEIRRVAAANNDRLADEIEAVRGLTVIDDLDNKEAERVASHYASMKDRVVYAEVNHQIRLEDPMFAASSRDLVLREVTDANIPNDPMFADQWALNNTGADGGKARADIDALQAWANTKGSDEVIVAVLDSGVDFTHPDLVGNMWIRPASVPAYVDDELGSFNDINGYNGVDAIRDPMDDNGHGTHCAGIIGAEGNNGIGITGINQKVRIMPLKFLGRGGFGSTNDAIEAINYAIDRKKHGVNVRIISASWGSTSKSKALEDAIEAAGDAGILFVAAAGNDSSDNDKRPHFPSNYDLPNVISVAALDRNDELASFSNYGAKSVHVSAPGKEILSTWLNNEYREASGTSMATPYVAGVGALIIASDPQISMKSLRARIIGTTDEIAHLNGRVQTGGRICAANALGNIVKGHVHR